MKVYIVNHYFDLDGGFGDAVPSEELVACFLNKEDAEDFIKKFNNDHVYDIPYAELHCGRLDIQVIDVFTHEDYLKTNFIWREGGWRGMPDSLINMKEKEDKKCQELEEM